MLSRLGRRKMLRGKGHPGVENEDNAQKAGGQEQTKPQETRLQKKANEKARLLEKARLQEKARLNGPPRVEGVSRRKEGDTKAVL